LVSVVAGPTAQAAGVGGLAAPELTGDERHARFGHRRQRVARLAGLLVLAATIVGLALLDYPVLFGRWESFVTYPMMQGPPPALTLENTPGGFTFYFNMGRFALVDLG
jgi:hypothetical protein